MSSAEFVDGMKMEGESGRVEEWERRERRVDSRSLACVLAAQCCMVT